jgi:hypothetical protein
MLQLILHYCLSLESLANFEVCILTAESYGKIFPTSIHVHLRIIYKQLSLVASRCVFAYVEHVYVELLPGTIVVASYADRRMYLLLNNVRIRPVWLCQ